ncbi:MAG: helix-turn-helix domain-containing protein [Bdellovibrionota bacterium]
MQETNESLGSYLKRSREGKNVSIEQVAYATRISLKMLRALEDDNHATLPAPTFVRGYLQAYAKYIRIDTQDLLLRYQHHLATSPDHKRNTIRSHYLYVRERYQEKRRLVLVIVLFATMLSVAGTYFLLKAKRDHHKRLAQTTAEIQKGENKSLPALPLALTPPTPSEKVAEMLEKEKKETPPKTEAKVETKTETQTETQTEVKVESKATELKNKLKAAVGLSTATHTQTEAKKEPAPAPIAPPLAPAVVPAVVPPKVVATPKPTATATATQTQVSVGDSAAAVAPDSKKAYNLLLKTDQDVWLRFQTDQDAVRDLTLRGGKAMMLRADSVIKIFSGNLTAFKATLNGKPLASLAPSNRVKSVVVPETEATKYPPPLFPQFQPKQDAEQNKKSEQNSGANSPNGDAAQ